MPVVADTSALKPLEVGTFLLGTHTVSVYYTVGGDTYWVVTTIAPDSDISGAPIRLIVFLPPGEKQVISVGSFGTTAEPETGTGAPGHDAFGHASAKDAGYELAFCCSSRCVASHRLGRALGDRDPPTAAMSESGQGTNPLRGRGCTRGGALGRRR
jgi:hypothetical protein